MRVRLPFFVSVCLLLLAGVRFAPAQEAPSPSVSNASPRDAAAISTTLTQLNKAAQSGDANALAYFGASPSADGAAIEVASRVTHVAVSGSGALVRELYGLSIARAAPVPLASGVQELWLARQGDGSFALTPHRFAAATDALSDICNTVQNDRSGTKNGGVLDVVASRVGGRWIALRRQVWSGTLGVALAGAGQSTREFVARQMDRAPHQGALTAHFLFQSDATSGAWTGLGAAWNPNKRADRNADALAASWRGRMIGPEYTSPSNHKTFALALMNVGLWNEGADELQKAALLDPSLVSSDELQKAERNRAKDPQLASNRQLDDEKQVGLADDHPVYYINALKMQQRSQPTALGALRIALEYSRLAQDERARAWMTIAVQLQKSGQMAPSDAAWMQLLFDHLRERERLSRDKPSAILSSQLFTVRCWPDDPNAVTLLAALEEAQHTVYADFTIPMGNTEVLLWHNQKEFARYTTQFSSQGGSEFVAALTLTKLVSTRQGPLVLGEEVNTFSDTDNTQPLFGTLAHEYGHVAVRELAKGRLVPVWFNEGIATSCEGGYEGYISRVRRAANAGTLLSMDEMMEWNVDGERAFLAYSQANSIVDFVVAKWGSGAVLDILRQIGRDVPPDEAFESVLGVSQTELWNRWVREGIK